MPKNYKFRSQSSYHEFTQDDTGKHMYGYDVKIDDINGDRTVSGNYYKDGKKYVIHDVKVVGNDIKYIARDQHGQEYVIDRDVLAKKLLG